MGSYQIVALWSSNVSILTLPWAASMCEKLSFLCLILISILDVAFIIGSNKRTSAFHYDSPDSIDHFRFEGTHLISDTHVQVGPDVYPGLRCLA